MSNTIGEIIWVAMINIKNARRPWKREAGHGEGRGHGCDGVQNRCPPGDDGAVQEVTGQG